MKRLLPKRLLLFVACAACAALPASAQSAPQAAATEAPAAAQAAPERIAPGGRRAAAGLHRGTASFYARSLHGRRTANGERYDHQALTAAHRTLPFGTMLRVTNERNGRSVVVRVNDRGPFHRSRVLDVSGAAAQQLGMTRSGTARITFEVVEEPRAVRRVRGA
ncbi:MAG: septal ring lytic transglycosylase RlpA family protein [Rubricoccaceae bacterium]